MIVTNHGTNVMFQIVDHEGGVALAKATFDPRFGADAKKHKDAGIVGVVVCHALLATIREAGHPEIQPILDEFEKIGFEYEYQEEAKVVDKDGNPLVVEGPRRPAEA